MTTEQPAMIWRAVPFAYRGHWNPTREQIVGIDMAKTAAASNKRMLALCDARSTMPDKHTETLIARMAKALIGSEPITSKDLAKAMGVSPGAVVRNMTQLRKRGIVLGEKRGRIGLFYWWLKDQNFDMDDVAAIELSDSPVKQEHITRVAELVASGVVKTMDIAVGLGRSVDNARKMIREAERLGAVAQTSVGPGKPTVWALPEPDDCE